VGLIALGVLCLVVVRWNWLGAKNQARQIPDVNMPGTPVPGLEAPEAEMTLADFLAQRPDKPSLLFAFCRLDKVYTFAYRNTVNTHYSVSLHQQQPVWKAGHAWVARDSGAGRRLFEILKDGRSRRLGLRVVLKGPDGRETPPGREEMAIVDVVE
jgi:hypothetical protein